MKQERIRIALQKSGRLAEDSLSLLRACGLRIDNGKDQLLCRVREQPIDLLFIRDDDIPDFVGRGICDLGIVGENMLAETQQSGRALSAKIVERLGFSFCRLSIAVPNVSQYQKIEDINGLTIATSYPQLLKRALKNKGLAATPLLMNGSVEVAPGLKIADAICDLVASGSTLAANNLREIAVLLQSEALLIRSDKKLCFTSEDLISTLVERIRGIVRADQNQKMIA